MKSALIVVDAQQSFLERPYWSETDAPRFIERLQMLIDRCRAQGVPVLQVFHVEEDDGPSNPFSRRSGHVKTLDGLRIEPTDAAPYGHRYLDGEHHWFHFRCMLLWADERIQIVRIEEAGHGR